MLDKEEWCIVRYVCDNEPRKGEVDILIHKQYQWEAQGSYYRHKWEYLARGLTEQQAKDYEKLFKE
jgi:hypothetical protein